MDCHGKVIEAARAVNEQLVARLVINQRKPNTRLTAQTLELLPEYRIVLCRSQIGDREAYRHAAAFGQTVHHLGPSAAAAISEIENLTDDVLSKGKNPQMSKDPMSGRLAKSLQAETAAVDDRFSRTETVLGGGQGASPTPRHAKAPARKKRIKVIRDSFSFPESDYALLSRLQQRFQK